MSFLGSITGSDDAKKAKKIGKQSKELRRGVAELQNTRAVKMALLQKQQQKATLESQAQASGTTGSSGFKGALGGMNSAFSETVANNAFLSTVDAKQSELAARQARYQERAASKGAMFKTALSIAGAIAAPGIGGALGSAIGGSIGGAIGGAIGDNGGAIGGAIADGFINS
jgi:hypothetical protein